MKIHPLLTFTGGGMGGKFVLGGSLPHESLEGTYYPYVILNYLVETKTDCLLLDTGMPPKFQSLPPNEKMEISFGSRISSLEDALEAVGKKPEDITKIILSHGDFDHTGGLFLFPNAEVFLCEKDIALLKKTEGLKLHPLPMDSAPKFGFSASYEVSDGITMVFAPGHSHGHCAVVIEDSENAKTYLYGGDATASDEALAKKALLLPHVDKALGLKSLEEICQFLAKHNAIYLSAHDPSALEKLKP